MFTLMRMLNKRLRNIKLLALIFFTVLEECSIQQTYLQQLRQSILQEAVQRQTV